MVKLDEDHVIQISKNKDERKFAEEKLVPLALHDSLTGLPNRATIHNHVDKKIDRFFVSGINQDANDEAIIKVIIDIAKSLELEVTAEGAETKKQVEYLKKHDCNNVQGFLL